MDTNETAYSTALPRLAFTKEEIVVNSISAVSCLGAFLFLIAAWCSDGWSLLYVVAVFAVICIHAVLYAVYVLGYHYAPNKW